MPLFLSTPRRGGSAGVSHFPRPEKGPHRARKTEHWRAGSGEGCKRWGPKAAREPEIIGTVAHAWKTGRGQGYVEGEGEVRRLLWAAMLHEAQGC